MTALRDATSRTREIVATWCDHSYIRRDGVLYESRPSGYNNIAERVVSEDEIPKSATFYNPPIRY